MSVIPNDDDISKTQLWKRIDEALDTINLVGINVQSTLDATLPALKRANDEAVAGINGIVVAAVADVRASSADDVKNLEKINNDAHTKLVADFQNYQKVIDQRFADLAKSIQEDTATSLSNAFTQIAASINQLHDTVGKYQMDTTAQVATLQVEMGRKLGEVVALFGDMRTKFQKISEQLK